ncbi:MAG: DUF1844 domain-containing protein [Bacteroidota bacterium]
MESQPSKFEALFIELVLIFQTAAMQHMGKVKNPLTDKIERNLEQARAAIDMLEMIEQKTKGNLTPEELRFLETTLRDLRLNYVDEVAKNEAAQKSNMASPPQKGESNP